MEGYRSPSTAAEYLGDSSSEVIKSTVEHSKQYIEQSFHQELVSVNADLAGDLDLSFQEGHDLITKFLPTANPGSTAGDVLEEACGSAIDINISMKSIHGELNETMRSEFSGIGCL